MKRAIVMGASSGIGHEVAQLLIADGWTVGVAARHIDKLTDLQNVAPERVVVAKIDVTDNNAETNFRQLIERIGGLNLYFHSAGIGWQNTTLDPDKEIKTMETNATAFTRMVGAAYRYFTENGGGHIACITSIAGTKGLGVLQHIAQQRLCRMFIFRLWNNWLLQSIRIYALQISDQALLILPYSLVLLIFLC